MSNRVLVSILLAISIIAPSVNTEYVHAKPKIKLSKPKVKLVVGKSVTLKLKNATKRKIKWTRSNNKVTVKNGRVVAKKIGSAKVYAKYKGKKYTCKFTITKKKATIVPTPTQSTSQPSKPTSSPKQTPSATPIATIEPTPEPTVAPTPSPEPTPEPRTSFTIGVPLEYRIYNDNASFDLCLAAKAYSIAEDSFKCETEIFGIATFKSKKSFKVTANMSLVLTLQSGMLMTVPLEPISTTARYSGSNIEYISPVYKRTTIATPERIASATLYYAGAFIS